MAAVAKYLHAGRGGAAQPFHLAYKYGREEAEARVAAESRAIYAGNLAFTTTDTQLRAVFSRCGAVERVVVGLNKVTRQPAGFAFVVFFERAAALDAVATLNLTVLDGRPMQVQVDKGFAWHVGLEEGFYDPRKLFGKGATGGQGRDERGDRLRDVYDEQRGGMLAGDGASLAAGAGPSPDWGAGPRRFSGVGAGSGGYGGGGAGGWGQQQRRGSYGDGGGGGGFGRGGGGGYRGRGGGRGGYRGGRGGGGGGSDFSRRDDGAGWGAGGGAGGGGGGGGEGDDGRGERSFAAEAGGGIGAAEDDDRNAGRKRGRDDDE